MCNKSSHSLIVSWTEPLNNGSGITEYRVQMATLFIRPQTPPPTPPDAIEEVTEVEVDQAINQNVDIDTTDSQPAAPETNKVVADEEATLTNFSQVYVGAALSCEVKGLQPATVYLFRVQVSDDHSLHLISNEICANIFLCLKWMYFSFYLGCEHCWIQ